MLIAVSIFTIIAAIAIVSYVKRKSSANSAQDNGNQVYVGNLHYRVQEFDLKKHFAKYGEINNIRIVKNRKTGRPKTFAFIKYNSANEANKALKSHGQMLNDRSLVVRIARSQDKS